MTNELTFQTSDEAKSWAKSAGGCVGRVRVEITAIEGQFDD